MADLVSLNPHLAPIKAEADAVWKAIEEFKRVHRLTPVYFHIPPSDWRAGIREGYCENLITIIDPSVAKFKVSA